MVLVDVLSASVSLFLLWYGFSIIPTHTTAVVFNSVKVLTEGERAHTNTQKSCLFEMFFADGVLKDGRQSLGWHKELEDNEQNLTSIKDGYRLIICTISV